MPDPHQTKCRLPRYPPLFRSTDEVAQGSSAILPQGSGRSQTLRWCRSGEGSCFPAGSPDGMGFYRVPRQNSYTAADLAFRARYSALRYSLISPPMTLSRSIRAVTSTTRHGGAKTQPLGVGLRFYVAHSSPAPAA